MSTFEFDGEKYKKASKHQKEWGSSLIGELSLSGTVLGIDASAGMIAAAQKRVQPNLSFLQMDINAMNFRDAFDVIFSNAALHWIKDHEKLLKNSFRALKNGGILLWDFAGDGNCSNFFEVVREKIQDENYKPYFRDYEWPWYMPARRDYEIILAAAGFSAYRITEVNRDRYFANADEMIRWIDQPSIVPFIRLLPDEKKVEFREEVIRSMLARTLQADGTCFETFRRIHVNAVK